MEMTCKEAAEVLRKPVDGMKVIMLDGEPEVVLTSDYCRAIEVALEALEGVGVQCAVIAGLNQDLKRCREAMNGQSEYAYLGGDLISREALKDRVEMIDWYSTNDSGVLHSGAAGDENAYVRYAEVARLVEEALAVESEPVVHARWKGAGLGDYLCSACWGVCSGGNRFKRCPHCGAHMDEEVAE